MCFSKVAKNVQKGRYVLLQVFVVFVCFTKIYVITQNQTEFQTSKLFQIDMDCTQTAQNIQTPLHLEVTFICTFLAYSMLKG